MEHVMVAFFLLVHTPTVTRLECNLYFALPAEHMRYETTRRVSAGDE